MMRCPTYLPGMMLLLTLAGSIRAESQSSSVIRPDSQMVFGTLTPRDTLSMLPEDINDAFGVDLLVTTSGFGMGLFYRHEYTGDLAGTIDFSISDSRDDREFEYYDPFTGRMYTPGKLNRFLVMPLHIGIQKRLFADEILDNFRPYISAAIGPTMIYVFPYNMEYFSALGKGQPRYTFGGYIGCGAYFGSERSSLFGVNIRYSFIPYRGGLESLKFFSGKTEVKDDFGSFMIALSWGGGW